MKDIRGYEGKYAITSCGRVWSYKREKFLKPRLDKHGYPRITLSHNGEIKTFLIHQLVAEAYIPNPDHLQEINHKDEIKTHSYVNNLEWCTHEYNVNYGTRNQRASAALMGHEGVCKRIYCLELNETFKSLKEASTKYNIDQGTISKCCSGKRKTAGKHPITGEPLHWEMVA